MKLAFLTSDALDGRIVIQELLRAKREVCLIVYEKRPMSPRARLKVWIYFLLKRIQYRTFEDIARGNSNILVEATSDMNSDTNVATLKKLAPDLIVVTGTRKLSERVFTAARHGAINLHSGILPFYRGSDSEFWALYRGEFEKVGVSIHFIDKGLDSGDVILMRQQEVGVRDRPSSLREKNIYLGARLLNEAINLIEANRANPKPQDNSLSKTHRAADEHGRRRLKQKRALWIKRFAHKKTFGTPGLNAVEEVAAKPLIGAMTGLNVDWPNIFCLRIDADEYDASTFYLYREVFSQHRKALTIFLNANSFYHQRSVVSDLVSLGIDIQSHGFYHHTYIDYASNRYNIAKAKNFFESLGIQTLGFAAPMGRWNKALMQALQDEGYKYASDFSYDYLGWPTYPCLGKRVADILEIPVFPVAPELFFQQPKVKFKEVLCYYRDVLDEMIRCGIPVIIYAHTSVFKEVPQLLEEVLDYALSKKNLIPATMTEFYQWWLTRQPPNSYPLKVEKKKIALPAEMFLGEEAPLTPFEVIKNVIKRRVDFERVTPQEELCCSGLQKMSKLILRKMSNKTYH